METRKLQCTVPGNIHTPPTERIGIYWGERGSLKTKKLKEMYVKGVLDISWNYTIRQFIINNYSPKWRWLVDICQAAKRRGKYPPLTTDTEVNGCFSIYTKTVR